MKILYGCTDASLLASRSIDSEWFLLLEEGETVEEMPKIPNNDVAYYRMELVSDDGFHSSEVRVFKKGAYLSFQHGNVLLAPRKTPILGKIKRKQRRRVILDTVYFRAYDLLRQKQYQDAYSLFQQSIQTERTDDPEKELYYSHMYLGDLYAMKNDIPWMMYHYIEAGKLCQYIDPWYKLGQLLSSPRLAYVFSSMWWEEGADWTITPRQPYTQEIRPKPSLVCHTPYVRSESTEGTSDIRSSSTEGTSDIRSSIADLLLTFEETGDISVLLSFTYLISSNADAVYSILKHCVQYKYYGEDIETRYIYDYYRYHLGAIFSFRSEHHQDFGMWYAKCVRYTGTHPSYASDILLLKNINKTRTESQYPEYKKERLEELESRHEMSLRMKESLIKAEFKNRLK